MHYRLTIFPLFSVSRNSGIFFMVCTIASLLLIMINPTTVYPQNNASLTSNIDSLDTEDSDERALPLPARASMLSATLPGLGQIYNKRYWKVPIIYAGFGALAYFVNHNSNEYQKYRSSYLARVDGNPNTTDEFPLHSTDVLQRAMNFYRRNLEVTYLLAAALYLLNILDANVDAHLMDFDVGENLSMRMSGISTTGYPSQRTPVSSPALTLRIKF